VKKLLMAIAFLAMAAGAAGQSGNLTPQGAYCLYADNWIPVAASTGTAAPESYPLVALYGENGTTWYPMACDASGNLAVNIGSNTQIAFNKAGTESGNPNLTWNTSTQNMTVNGAIVNQTSLSLAAIGIFNPTVMPVTTAQATLANQSGLATNSQGQAIPGIQKYTLTSQYSNATATPTAIGNWSFPVAASANYHIECEGRYKAAAGGALVVTLTGPATPTNIGYTYQLETALAANAGTYLDYEQGVSQSYPAPINSTAVTTSATDMSFRLVIDLNNGSTAGILVIKGSSISTNTLNVEIGSTCNVFPN
jgi:hypothetical protein